MTASTVIRGEPRTYTRSSWSAMRARCLNPTRGDYQFYGARGVSICDRWLLSFSAFLEDMGARPKGTSLDRINNDGNYEPANCRWATRSEQQLNRRPKPVRICEVEGCTGTHKSHGLCFSHYTKQRRVLLSKWACLTCGANTHLKRGKGPRGWLTLCCSTSAYQQVRGRGLGLITLRRVSRG